MSRCMFCKRLEIIFSVHAENVNKVIIEFLGSFRNGLITDRGVCAACLNLISNLCAIKGKLVELAALADVEDVFISSHADFLYGYTTFLHNLQSSKYRKAYGNQPEDDNTSVSSHTSVVDDAEENLPERLILNANEVQNRHVNDMDLLTPLRVEPFKQEKGNKRSFTPGTNAEVESVFEKKPKRRKKLSERWTNWTKKRAQSAVDMWPRSTSSLQTKVRPRSSQSMILTSSTFFDVNNMKCILGCPETFDDVQKLTLHKLIEHHMPGCFRCKECFSLPFTSQQDLNVHTFIHHTTGFITHCLLCSEQIQGILQLQYHLLQHKKQSIKCLYCDKAFIRHQDFNHHMQMNHPRSKKERNFRKSVICEVFYLKDAPPVPDSIETSVVVKELNAQIDNEQSTSYATTSNDVHEDMTTPKEYTTVTRMPESSDDSDISGGDLEENSCSDDHIEEIPEHVTAENSLLLDTQN